MIRLGTRGSKLALAQAHFVTDRLRALGAEVEVTIITTTGDRATSSPADSGITGIFVKELEAALLDGGIDLAVHSLKDMTTTLPQGLTLGAVPERASPLDALVCRQRGASLHALPAGSRVGTSSPRRRAQLLHYRPDLQVRPLRGNVDTRLRKLDAGALDAVVLAHAGLLRLGMESVQPWAIPPDICLPAPGQGALAIEVRAHDDPTAGLVSSLDDVPTRACVTAERAFLRALGGGCHAAVGALARMEGATMTLQGAVASQDGDSLIRGAAQGTPAEAQGIGLSLAEDLGRRGAGALIEVAK